VNLERLAAVIFWIDAQLPPQLASWLSQTFKVEAYALRDLQLRDAKMNRFFKKRVSKVSCSSAKTVISSRWCCVWYASATALGDLRQCHQPSLQIFDSGVSRLWKLLVSGERL